MTAERVITTDTPPVIVRRDGKLYVLVMTQDMEVLSPIGDGRYFLSLVFDYILKPLLKAQT